MIWKKLKKTKQNKELYENRRKQNVQDKKMLVVKYSDLFNYLKKHKIDPNNVQEAKQFLKSEYTNKKVGGAITQQLTEKIIKDYLKHVQEFFLELQASDDVELIMHEFSDRIKSINDLFTFLRENAKRLNSELTQKEYNDIERKFNYLKTFFEPLPELIDALYLDIVENLHVLLCFEFKFMYSVFAYFL
ncbi:MAG: hypothetical protein K2X39_02925 [Silvanigrellaceae bacterium]|nr:hypothetical protein [Silvanigrellaceae bacterium]